MSDRFPRVALGEDWSGVSLRDFLRCEHNLGNNRQVRMLANLSLVGCYDTSTLPPDKRDAILIQSAKSNLQSMAFFGLTEFQAATQYLFERTFKLKFIEDFVQYNQTHASQTDVSSSDLDLIRKVNRLDLELYSYAKELFFQRLKHQIEEDVAAERTVVIPEALVRFLEQWSRTEDKGGAVQGGSRPLGLGELYRKVMGEQGVVHRADHDGEQEGEEFEGEDGEWEEYEEDGEEPQVNYAH